MKNIFGTHGHYTGYVDEHGNPVERTPQTHRYSYSPYVQYKVGEATDANNVVYSDRLLQWDHEKTRKLMRKHFHGKDGDYYTDRDPKDIEAFLSDYFDKPVELLIIMEGCNVSSGYPYWVFFMRDKEVYEKNEG